MVSSPKVDWPAPDPIMLTMSSVTFRYEDMTMSFDLQVAAGECLAIIGPSGAGKSTLLSLIAGFERPESGRILIDGRDMAGVIPARRPVTSLFQEHNLFAHLSLADNVGLGLDPGLALSTPQRAAVAEALAQVGLSGLEARKPGQLSGGERQRAALARSLVRNKPLLLLDEPFAALGPAQRREMLDLVNRLARARGFTILFVSHQPEDARHAAGRTIFIEAGRIQADGPTAALFDSPDGALAAYLGRD
jgi:thiamine transport system ATP-binding protein